MASVTVGGIVLCGGLSSRMGRPKAWLPVGDELLLPRVARILAEVVSPVVVVAAVGQDLPLLPAGVRIVRDEFPERGPLQGMLAGFEALPDVEAAYVSACDVPLLRADFVRRVVESLGPADAAGPDVEGHVQPLASVYRIEPALRAVRQLLGEGRFAVRELFAALNATRIGSEALSAVDPALDSLKAANTPEEFARLRQSAPPPGG